MTLKKLTVTLLLSWLERLYNGFILSDAHDISCQFHILQCPSFSCGSFKVLQKDFLKDCPRKKYSFIGLLMVLGNQIFRNYMKRESLKHNFASSMIQAVFAVPFWLLRLSTSCPHSSALFALPSHGVRAAHYRHWSKDHLPFIHQPGNALRSVTSETTKHSRRTQHKQYSRRLADLWYCRLRDHSTKHKALSIETAAHLCRFGYFKPQLIEECTDALSESVICHHGTRPPVHSWPEQTQTASLFCYDSSLLINWLRSWRVSAFSLQFLKQDCLCSVCSDLHFCT